MFKNYTLKHLHLAFPYMIILWRKFLVNMANTKYSEYQLPGQTDLPSIPNWSESTKGLILWSCSRSFSLSETSASLAVTVDNPSSDGEDAYQSIQYHVRSSPTLWRFCWHSGTYWQLLLHKSIIPFVHILKGQQFFSIRIGWWLHISTKLSKTALILGRNM